MKHVLFLFVFLARITNFTCLNAQQQVTLKNGKTLTFNLPQGYQISVAYQGLRRLRFMTKSPDGRLFVTDMHGMADNRRSKVYILSGWDDVNKRFTTKHTYLSGMHNINQVLFLQRESSWYIYLPETGRLSYYTYHSGQNRPRGRRTTIARFPAYGLSYKYGGWHLTRTLASKGDKLYVSVGSSCNSCLEKEQVRASVIEMRLDGSDQKIYASGLRNAVGLKFVRDELWATEMGSDHLGADAPADRLLRVEENGFYGWPFYYQTGSIVHADPALQAKAQKEAVVIPEAPKPAGFEFPAHSAPLGLEYFRGFKDPLLKDKIVVALHGSTDYHLQRGYKLVLLSTDGKWQDLITGFQDGKEKKNVKGRPCDVMMNDDRSFFITDDMNGALYYVWWNG